VTIPAHIQRGRDELVLRVRRSADPAELFAEASTRLRRLVPFDSSAWMATDPGTGFPTSPTRVENCRDAEDPERCSAYWRAEILSLDINLFRDLVRAEIPAASLRATARDPHESIRFRTFVRPSGFDDELRSVFRVGENPWGYIVLFRREGRPAFSRLETRVVASLSEPLGEALAGHARPPMAVDSDGENDGPGFMLFDRGGTLISANEEARMWLSEVSSDVGDPSDHGFTVPVWIKALVIRAAAVDWSIGDGTARARLRTRRGRWLVCYASSLRDADGSFGNTAVIIEPAKAGDIAPIVAQAYDLSDREQQVIRLIARGASTSKIARELYLSAHTVRDYVKAIFQKVDVSSRGELVARLFTDYHQTKTDDVVRVVD
jgi:DNA-binding CsgD family transcriptional regulator